MWIRARLPATHPATPANLLTLLDTPVQGANIYPTPESSWKVSTPPQPMPPSPPNATSWQALWGRGHCCQNARGAGPPWCLDLPSKEKVGSRGSPPCGLLPPRQPPGSDLQHLLFVGRRVQRRVCDHHGVLLRGDAQHLVERVMPDLGVGGAR